MIVHLYSGGVDSTVLLYDLLEEHDVVPLLVDHGQPARPELEYAEQVARQLMLNFAKLDLREAARGILGQGAARRVEHYALPGELGILVAVAISFALERRAAELTWGLRLGGTTRTSPNRSILGRISCEGFAAVSGVPLRSPLFEEARGRIVARGEELGAPWRQTWSCLKGGDAHCGTCPGCADRAAGFREAEIEDPTLYTRPPLG